MPYAPSTSTSIIAKTPAGGGGEQSFVPYSSSDPCAALAKSLHHPKTVVLSAERILAGSNVTVTGGQLLCQSFFLTTIEVCRVIGNITTSNRSSTLAEFWLPNLSEWTGRVLSTGGGGLGGCIDYDRMAYTTSLGFAATGDNGGHDGYSGEAFGGNDDVVIDFSYRARHVTIELGKSLVKSYYHKPQDYTYYFGCSTGGRQGVKAAQMFPEDFDGIIAGAPAMDLNHLCAWGAISTTSPAPTLCIFDPDPLRCKPGANTSACLTDLQVQTVHQVYRPLYGEDGTLLYPRFSPSSELSSLGSGDYGYLGGGTATPATDWFKYAIYNDPSFDITTLDYADIAYADSLDAAHGYVSSFAGDLSEFRRSGGKMISYHGFSDPIIPAENSLRYYKVVADTMQIGHTDIDTFFRMFPISGMDHCQGGPGAWAFGQISGVANSTDNIIWDIVRWVEQGIAPDRLTGAKFVNDSAANPIEFRRAHCRYPYRTTYIGGNPNTTTSWDCELIEGW
ncbi:tannase and feruloyl esterase [Byssothecium circinans]|uniref:Carboxylic ester hydrolase n=1 Tax=Byssothecium circinans TaxID=147558 RepID=A0A6A5TSS5_9PLEO|nr:tannase and feruloyl esterase [Byssothecium circinans]